MCSRRTVLCVDTHEDRQQVGPESVQSDTSPSCAIKSSSMTAGARVIKVEVEHMWFLFW